MFVFFKINFYFSFNAKPQLLMGCLWSKSIVFTFCYGHGSSDLDFKSYCIPTVYETSVCKIDIL